MVTKKDLPVMNTAYYCGTGARLAPPHPSPAIIYQAAAQLEKASIKSIEKAFKGCNVTMLQTIQTIPWLNNAPWANGNILNISLHPLIANFGNLAFQHGLIQPNHNPITDLLSVSSISEQLQYHSQTIEFSKILSDWSTSYGISKQEVNAAFCNIEKNCSGFELQEFFINYDAAQNSSLQLESLKTLISDEIKVLLNQNGADTCLAIFLKKEPCLNQRINLRYIVVLKKDFIDEPIGFTDFSFFQTLRNTVESNSCYTIAYDTGLLNGFLANNRFSKKNPNYRERIKCLKTYLIGTDALYRIDGLQPTFDVIYSKFN